MNKDVIYIDIEDDITAVIGKIKNSKDKIVALVPPKRVGMLQSAVNLRLLARTALSAHKHLVLITNDKALSTLAGTAKIPVAKNLQSKPEIAQIAALSVDEGDDIIDGAQLPVGELATMTVDKKDIPKDVFKKTEENNDNEQSEDDAITDIRLEEKDNVAEDKEGVDKKKSKVKVPSFSKFRKRMFLGITGGAILIAFLVWANLVAPAAKITITAKTESAPVSVQVKLGGTSATDTSKGIIQTVSKQLKKDMSVDFTATGQKDLGEKAKGAITIENCDSSDSITIPANTIFTADTGQKYINTTAVTVPGLSGSASLCRLTGAGAGTADSEVIADQPGTNFNIDSAEYAISGVSGYIYAHGEKMTGGTSKMTTVVTAEDVQKASQALVDLPTDEMKAQLKAQFTNGEKIIDESFSVERAQAVSMPAIGAELAAGKAKLTSAVTFTISAIAKSELEAYLKYAINKQIDGAKNQRIYDTGADKVSISNYVQESTFSTVNIATTGQVGPDIQVDDVKNLAKGKRFGDIQSTIGAIKGVSDVQVKFSYFWVNTVPNENSKIEVIFNLQNE